MRLWALAASAAFTLAATAGCEKIPDNELGKADIAEPAAASATSLGETLALRSDLSTYRRLVAHAGLEGPLEGASEYTVFAPTDDAFAALPGGVLATLMSEDGKVRAASLVTEQLVPGYVTRDDLRASVAANGGSARLTTLGGSTLVVREQDGKLLISNGDGQAVGLSNMEVKSKNGVILPIDGLLIAQ